MNERPPEFYVMCCLMCRKIVKRSRWSLHLWRFHKINATRRHPHGPDGPVRKVGSFKEQPIVPPERRRHA